MYNVELNSNAGEKETSDLSTLLKRKDGLTRKLRLSPWLVDMQGIIILS